jgi:hypothetical protein
MDVAVKVALNHSDTTRSHKSSSYCRYAKEITLFPFRHFEGEQISFQFFTPDRWEHFTKTTASSHIVRTWLGHKRFFDECQQGGRNCQFLCNVHSWNGNMTIIVASKSKIQIGKEEAKSSQVVTQQYMEMACLQLYSRVLIVSKFNIASFRNRE